MTHPATPHPDTLQATAPTTPATPALIAFDMDGTLFASNHQPLPSSIRAIHAALDRGARIALASGRDPFALRLIAQHVGLDPAQLVFFGLNGTIIVDGATDRVLWDAQLDRNLLTRLMAHLRTFDVTTSISAGDTLYVEDPDGFNVALEASANGQQVVHVDRLEDAPVPARKVLTSAPPQVLAAQHLAMTAPFVSDLDVAFSAPTHFEFTPAGVNKGAALAHYCEVVGIDLADTVAFGDNENDLGMLRTAGLGVAMGNALDTVKAAADVITADHDSDGIALVLAGRFGLA